MVIKKYYNSYQIFHQFQYSTKKLFLNDIHRRASFVFFSPRRYKCNHLFSISLSLSLSLSLSIIYLSIYPSIIYLSIYLSSKYPQRHRNLACLWISFKKLLLDYNSGAMEEWNFWHFCFSAESRRMLKGLLSNCVPQLLCPLLFKKIMSNFIESLPHQPKPLSLDLYGSLLLVFFF